MDLEAHTGLLKSLTLFTKYTHYYHTLCDPGQTSYWHMSAIVFAIKKMDNDTNRGPYLIFMIKANPDYLPSP